MHETPKTMRLGDIAALVGGELHGPEGLEVSGLQALDRAGPDELSFVVSGRYREAAAASRAAALVLPADWAEPPDRPAVFVRDPYLAYAKIAQAFFEAPRAHTGVHPGARVAEGARVEEPVTVHAGAHVADGAVIRRGAVLHPGVVVGEGAEIGEETELFPNVVIYPGCRVGARVRIHAGAVIGADGFGYAQEEGRHVKIPQVGIVVIEDDVEIGANTTIDRAAFGETVIGRGTKIDNLVQVGHNVRIGPDCIIVAQVGISGSCRLGRGVMLGGQAGLSGHITLGDGVRVVAQSGLLQPVPAGETVAGTPAVRHRLWLRISQALRRLPDLAREVRDLARRLEALEQRRD
ncbi:UDP-3-O-(3-hydroxymyristoyl)glucosamine N-acyltransferase [Dissulfurirhabdus thermomarina]|uniref:UDP-3-O-acylglucosamine N-acyltransferase n=1 Tax=Dissulfurirhabdus thermomarina TaxID=1765737 RepID=A0A6N9TSR6_DISTH|nr:UDP-3-O-(3-hydroxymyristoyl)glucosamine N-acyltransferase [Dissulfurirhabdus thermomarina]NDY42784.1 UDP-3-O-(3-hydroxymyristoyl)glucosamine N-acyltransferase [Dissulfurirhabdus thermomarina]NMX23556.1 UDP-3-O-(3-hydroxymyristoyl)glucosamine N-acyltransferase [Dissulfurirhabdus thermomarina]